MGNVVLLFNLPLKVTVNGTFGNYNKSKTINDCRSVKSLFTQDCFSHQFNLIETSNLQFQVHSPKKFKIKLTMREILFPESKLFSSPYFRYF